jgi:hypothetical protein
MRSAKTFVAFMLLLFLVMPAKISFSQQSDPESAQVDETEMADKTTDKKKTKKVVEINDHFFLSLAINMAAVFLIIFFIYYPNYRKLDNIFTFVIFNLVIFLLTFVMKYVKLSMGAAFGLFAVFSMLRYRTAGISMKDMTYLFIFIALGLISAINLEITQLLTITGLIVAGTFVMDSKYIIKRELCKSVQYENIELIKPGHQAELIEDLKKRTGLNIHRITINKINFLRDTASIKIYYHE